MVHVKKCPLGKRGRPSTEFRTEEGPQIYCSGWFDQMTDEALDECKRCLDWANGDQVQRDMQLAILEGALGD